MTPLTMVDEAILASLGSLQDTTKPLAQRERLLAAVCEWLDDGPKEVTA